LVEANWLQNKKITSIHGGKTKEIFYINPMVNNISNT